MKAFISHSSLDKPYVEQLIEEVGRDMVTFDKYSFAPGETLSDNIRKGIEDCDIFILIISTNSIDSTWVSQEIELAASLIVTKGIEFTPYCIDCKVKMQDPRLPAWVWQRLVKYYPYPKLLARTIQRVIRKQIWNKHPDKKRQDTLFIGRNDDMGSLEKQYYQEDDSKLKAIFLSGFPFVGRKTLHRQFINRYIKRNTEAYNPIVVSLDSSNSLEQLTQQLNEHVGRWPNDQLLLMLADGKDAVLQCCSELLNILSDNQEKVIIDDDACIVKPGGGIEEWFLDVVNLPNMSHEITFFIASRYRPNPVFVNKQESLMEMPVGTLHRDDMYNLLKGCLDIRGKKLNAEDMDFFVDSFTGYPKQAIDMADYISQHLLLQAKRHSQILKASYDGNYSVVIDELSTNAKDLLFLLSKFDFVSTDLLQEIYGADDLLDPLSELDTFSLYEVFGLSQQYISLNHSVADYVLRTKQQMSKTLKQKFSKVTKRILSDIQSELTDLSSSLLNIKENIRANIARIDECYLIPSFVLKVIVEEYHAENDDNVIAIAQKLIHDYRKVNYESCIRAIHYWLCCSLCRLQRRDSFDKEVQYFVKTPFDYNYLQGFYRRHHNKRSKWEEAKYYYEQALSDHDRSIFSLTSVAKVEHEQVIVLSKLRDYSSALSLAKRNYENNTHNTYHIRAYFNCLTHTSSASKEEMQRLISAMKETRERGVALFVPTMQIQYDYYCNHDFPSAVNQFRKLLYDGGKPGSRYTIDVFKDLCRIHSSMMIFEEIVKGESSEESQTWMDTDS